MFRHVPNALTGGRLVLAGVFFAMLAWYQYKGRGDPWFLNTAFFIYCVALFTDFLDGYLARKWKVEGAFGRVVGLESRRHGSGALDVLRSLSE